MAHATATESDAEAAYLADQWRWLLQPGAAPDERAVTWSGESTLSVALTPSAGQAWVLVKESMVPGWRAELVTPGGTRQVDVQAGEMDFVLIRLDAIPTGSRLVLTYGPTPATFVSWAVSLAALAALLAWTAHPPLLESPAARMRQSAAAAARRVTAAWGREDA